MTWFAVDDRFPVHRKVLRLRRSPHFSEAVALWTLAGAWACGQQTEQHTGRVPVDVVATFGVAAWQEALDALVDAELWHCDGDLVTFHDWEHWNGPEARHNRSREQTAQRQRAKRLRDCNAGDHSKDCPTRDLDGKPHTCPRRAALAASRDARKLAKGPRNAASRDAGTGRGESTTGSPTDPVLPDVASPREDDVIAAPLAVVEPIPKGSTGDVWPDWPEVREDLRTPAALRRAAGDA